MKNPFKEDPEKKAARLARRAEHEVTRKAKYQERMSKIDERVAVAKGKLITADLDSDRFEIAVSQNLTGLGGPYGGAGHTVMAAYHVVVTDTETGVPQLSRHAPSYMSAHKLGRMYVHKLVTGKRGLKV